MTRGFLRRRFRYALRTYLLTEGRVLTDRTNHGRTWRPPLSEKIRAALVESYAPAVRDGKWTRDVRKGEVVMVPMEELAHVRERPPRLVVFAGQLLGMRVTGIDTPSDGRTRAEIVGPAARRAAAEPPMVIDHDGSVTRRTP